MSRTLLPTLSLLTLLAAVACGGSNKMSGAMGPGGTEAAEPTPEAAEAVEAPAEEAPVEEAAPAESVDEAEVPAAE